LARWPGRRLRKTPLCTALRIVDGSISLWHKRKPPDFDGRQQSAAALSIPKSALTCVKNFLMHA
jgi:hypothetical protein